MNLESSKVVISKNAEDLFLLLDDVKNFEKLMPESINKFEVLNENTFIFALTGMPEICLEKKDKNPHSQIVMGATRESKIPFTLCVNLSELNKNQTEIQFLFEGNFNPMIAMMVKSPISKFIETLANKSKEL